MALANDYALTVKIAFGSNPTQAVASPSPTWTDITDDVISILIKRGREDITKPSPPGICNLELNNDSGDYDPDYSSGTFYGNWLPGSHVWVSAQQSDTTVKSLFYGFIRYDEPISVEFPEEGYRSVTMVRCLDILGIFGYVPFDGLTPSSPDAGTAIDEAIDAVGYTSVARTIDTGVAVLQSGELEWDGTLLTFIEQCARSDGGVVFCDSAGHFYFDNRHAIQSKSRLTSSQATFSDSDPPLVTELPYRRMSRVEVW